MLRSLATETDLGNQCAQSAAFYDLGVELVRRDWPTLDHSAGERAAKMARELTPAFTVTAGNERATECRSWSPSMARSARICLSIARLPSAIQLSRECWRRPVQRATADALQQSIVAKAKFVPPTVLRFAAKQVEIGVSGRIYEYFRRP